MDTFSLFFFLLKLHLISRSYHVFERHLKLPHCSAQGTDPGPRLLILQTWRSTCLLPLFVLTQTPAIHCSNFNRCHCNKTAVFLVQCKAMSSSTTPRHSSILGLLGRQASHYSLLNESNVAGTTDTQVTTPPVQYKHGSVYEA